MSEFRGQEFPQWQPANQPSIQGSLLVLLRVRAQSGGVKQQQPNRDLHTTPTATSPFTRSAEKPHMLKEADHWNPLFVSTPPGQCAV